MHSSEAREQELLESLSHATRPLLRQIESLQEAANSQAASWEVKAVYHQCHIYSRLCCKSVESNLLRRLQEAQTAASNASVREQQAIEQAASEHTRVATLEVVFAVYSRYSLTSAGKDSIG